MAGHLRHRWPALLLLIAGAGADEPDSLRPKWVAGQGHRVSYLFSCQFNIDPETGQVRRPSISYKLEEEFKEAIRTVEEGRPREVERTYRKCGQRLPGIKATKPAKNGLVGRPVRLRVKKGALIASGKDKKVLPKTLSNPGSWCRWEALLEKPPAGQKLQPLSKDALRSLFPPEIAKRLAKPLFTHHGGKPIKLRGEKAIELELTLVCEMEKIPKGKFGFAGTGKMRITLGDRKFVEIEVTGSGTCPEGRNMWTGPWEVRLTHEPWKPPKAE